MRGERAEWELAQAFAEAHYRLPAERGGWALTFEGGARQEMRASEARTVLPVGTWAIVTAENPMGEVLSVQEIAERMRLLEAEVGELGARWERMWNCAADGTHREASLLVIGVGRADVHRLCVRFRQAAAVYGVGAKCGLLWMRSERWVVLGARFVRTGELR